MLQIQVAYQMGFSQSVITRLWNRSSESGSPAGQLQLKVHI